MSDEDDIEMGEDDMAAAIAAEAAEKAAVAGDDDEEMDMAAAMAADPSMGPQSEDDDEEMDMAAAMAGNSRASSKSVATLGGQHAHLVDGKAVGDVFVNVSIMLGKATLRVHQLLKLGRGAVVELERKLDEPVEIFANDILVAKGDVVVTDDNKIAVTLTEMVNKYQ